MLRVQRRIDKLELALGLSDRFKPVVHHINFIDSDGTITGTLVLSHGPRQHIPSRAPSEKCPKEVE